MKRRLLCIFLAVIFVIGTVPVSYGAASCYGGEDCPCRAYTDLDHTLPYHEAVDFVLHKGLMNGVGDGEFLPEGTLSRAMVVTVLWRLEGAPMWGQGKSGTFVDVPEYTWYTQAVEWAAAKEIIQGYGNGCFGPEEPVTRQQLAVMLYRYRQYQGGGFQGMWMFLLSYADREEIADWAYEAMCWMSMHGVITGEENNMVQPHGTVCRWQGAAAFMELCRQA